MRLVGGCAKLGRRGGRVLSAAAIRKIYVLHTLVQGAIFTRSSSGDGIHTRGESQTNATAPSNIYTTHLDTYRRGKRQRQWSLKIHIIGTFWAPRHRTILKCVIIAMRERFTGCDMKSASLSPGSFLIKLSNCTPA